MEDYLLAIFLSLNAAGVLWAYWDIWKDRSLRGSGAFLVGALLLIPVLGFLLYLWLMRAPAPQAKDLMGNMPRGAYTHHMISLKAALEATKADPDRTQRDGESTDPRDQN